MNDRNMKRIDEVSKKKGNEICVDCGTKNPEWASYNLGIFLCTTCATFHRKLGSHISKVKSLYLDTWDDELVEKMESSGNHNAKKHYEKHVPSCYRRPCKGDPLILLEQWVRAKYEREEFAVNETPKYLKGFLEESLLMKKRKEDTYSPRKFCLSEKDFTLSIFKEDTKEKEPKIRIPLGDLNVSLAPMKMNFDNCMQLTYLFDSMTRHLFVRHDSGQTIINWYTAIRNAKLNLLMVAYPSTKESELIPYLTKDFAMEGYLSKTGPNESDAYRKRWFTLDDRKLMYHLHPLDDSPKGEIFLGHKDSGYIVKEGVLKGHKDQGFPFCLYTPDHGRTFVFSSTSSDERSRWIEEINKVFEKPLRPQDNQCKATLETARKRISRQSWFAF